MPFTLTTGSFVCIVPVKESLVQTHAGCALQGNHAYIVPGYVMLGTTCCSVPSGRPLLATVCNASASGALDSVAMGNTVTVSGITECRHSSHL